jgi:release factor glutamine methyltransferase
VTATGSATVSEALQAAVDAFGAAGVQAPRLDAELLLAEVSGRDRARLAARPEEALPPGASRAFAAMVRRRLRREPLAYILGRKGFRRIELEVDPRALIPRPETELLVEVALELGPRRVLDVGTGSGAVALAVADELAETKVTATDTSAGALDLARVNAARLGLAERVRVIAGTVPDGEFDLLLANLPYVSEEEWEELAPEIREFEPREALVPGPTGIEAIEALLGEVAGHGARPSAIALEVGAGQAGRVAELVQDARYGPVEVRRDLAGIDRVVVGIATTSGAHRD